MHTDGSLSLPHILHHLRETEERGSSAAAILPLGSPCKAMCDCKAEQHPAQLTSGFPQANTPSRYGEGNGISSAAQALFSHSHDLLLPPAAQHQQAGVSLPGPRLLSALSSCLTGHKAAF